ncbi:aminotransferase class III-fold pyridoxal phosphate-dependent enzyme [Amycolatopsis sp. NPDC088138]|uniref:aminotransferase class III-fold pyridoxal phosphate-dependent enzyme n=1 Tax=Amycolatopsis sp. NPDC088138 TaxID=3363938 RepID=UPI0038072C00
MTVLDVLKDHYGLTGVDVFPLGGELDENSVVRLDDGSRVVVKVSPPRADVARIRWQHELMRLADAGGVRVPRVRAALDGESLVVTGRRAVTVQSWLDGPTLSELDSHAPELLEELGATAARLVGALKDAPKPPDSPPSHWDVLRAAEAMTDDAVDDHVWRIVARYSQALERHGSALPQAVVHQDFNDFNVLARREPDGRHHVHAVLDFGDALHTARVGELAVAVAYAMLRKADPLAAAAAVVRGYTAESALEDAELSVLFLMAAARLCVNAVTWTRRATAYGDERMRHTRPAIAALAATPPELAEAVLREAAGRPATVWTAPAAGAPPKLPAGVSWGRHLEPRSPVRRTTAGGEAATLRLGLVLESPEPFTVYSPFDAVVVRGEPATVLLRHDRPEPFWSRWTGVTTPHRDGDPIAAGAPIGRAGAAVRVALFRSAETAALAPGLVPASQAAAWASVSPDPAEFLGLPAAPRGETWDVERVVTSRSVHFARSQRSYYRRPMNLVGGRGNWLHDDRGRAYLDAINNVSHVGHANPRVVAAATAQLRKLNTNSRFVYPGIAEYAERLTATLPEPLRVAFFVCSGSEANDLAVRMARQVTGRRDVLVVDGAYHGNTSVLTGLSPNRYKGPGGTGPDPSTHEVEQPDRYRGRHGYGDPAAGRAYAADVRRQADRHPPAAFIAESAMGTAGSVFYPDGYLAEAFAAVRAAGGLCICDEVQVGFGRFGDVFWGFESQGVVPDIVTMGKPIGNGHPLAAVVTTREIADEFDTGMKYFNTFGGNPVSCAIGLAVLDEIAEQGLQRHAAETGRHFKDVLDALAGRHELIGDVRGHGMYLGVELVRDRVTKEPAGAEALHVSELMKDEGVLVYPTGATGSVLKIKPPLTFTTEDADLFGATLDEVLGRAW